MNALLFLMVVVTGLCFSPNSFAGSQDQDLIRETEQLLLTLPVKDPGRPQLALRLADLCFDESVRASQDISGKIDPVKEGSSFRGKALKYYRLVLDGFNGFFEKPVLNQKYKIDFQVARILTEEGQWNQAEPIWRSLLSQSTMKPLRREAALRLAEKAEQKNTPDSLKEAYAHYNTAFELCEGGDVCSYIQFRRAWILSRQDRKLAAALEMENALFDSKGQVREESLRDYINFASEAEIDFNEMIVKVQNLEQKLNRTDLSLQLAEAYFAHGRKAEGIGALEVYYRRQPELKHLARMLEESYGLRDLEKVSSLLAEAASFVRKQTNGRMEVAHETWKDDKESERVLRRLTVQLDGERQTKNEYVSPFKSSVLLYLSAFPQSPERQKMMDGWLAAELSETVKMAQLENWIQEEAQLKSNRVQSLRETRAAVAQKAGNLGVVQSEMTALLALNSSTHDQKRKHRYVRARAAYDEKKYDEALLDFRELARAPFDSKGSMKPDTWAIQSQNLALDILNIRKDFQGVADQASVWLNEESLVSAAGQDAVFKKELSEMKEISEKARFQNAATKGESPAALAVYFDYCMKDQFKPQSCENAKILSVKLKDQKTLIALLRKQGPEMELAAELEAAGEFVEAGKIYERNFKSAPTTMEFLRIALLYELAGAAQERDRLLSSLGSFLRKVVKSSNGQQLTHWKQQEPLVYRTLLESGLPLMAIWDLPWSPENRVALADQMELANSATPATRKLLTETCGSYGEGWKTLSLAELKTLDNQQRAIGFYGPKGKQLFERRIGALKKLTDRVSCYLKGAPSAYRVRVAASTARSLNGLVKEIVETPLPSELNAEQAQAVKTSLEEIAKPFRDQAQAYIAIAETEVQKVSAAERASLEELYLLSRNGDKPSQDTTTLWAASSDLKVPDERTKLASANLSPVRELLSQLKSRSSDRQLLGQIRDEFSKVGLLRLAAYFEGRLNGLAGGK